MSSGLCSFDSYKIGQIYDGAGVLIGTWKPSNVQVVGRSLFNPFPDREFSSDGEMKDTKCEVKFESSDLKNYTGLLILRITMSYNFQQEIS